MLAAWKQTKLRTVAAEESKDESSGNDADEGDRQACRCDEDESRHARMSGSRLIEFNGMRHENVEKLVLTG